MKQRLHFQRARRHLARYRLKTSAASAVMLGIILLNSLAVETARSQEQILISPDQSITLDLSSTLQLPTEQPGTFDNFKLNSPIVVFATPPQKGKLSCSNSVDGDGLSCGSIDALKLGAYKKHKSSQCKSGTFYDSAFGGSCWTCPSGYIRSTLRIDGNEACWKASSLKYAVATFEGKTCRAGEFWDPINGGECWSCPADYNRTWDHVTWKTACAKTLTGPFSKATRKRKDVCKSGFYDIGRNECWSCPSGYSRTLHPVDNKRACVRSTGTLYSQASMSENLGCGAKWAPGLPRPFLRLLDSNCYACPVIDPTNGDVVISEQGVLSPTKCAVENRWTPVKLHAYSLSQMKGAELLAGEILAQPELLTNLMHYRAKQEGNRRRRAFAENAWKEIVQRPLDNPYVSSLLGIRLLKAAQLRKEHRSKAEAELVASFQKFVDERRLAIAQDNLDMYDAWKSATDLQKSMAARSRLAQLFDYGTVPPDFIAAGRANVALEEAAFANLVAAPIATGFLASSLGTAAYFNSVNGWWVAQYGDLPKTVKIGHKALRYITKLDKALRPLGTTSVVKDTAGYFRTAMSTVRNVKTITKVTKATAPAALVIGVAGGVLADIAIEQVIEIETLRPKLVRFLATAKQPVDLADLAKNQPEQVMFWWSLLSKTPSSNLPKLVEIAKRSTSKAQTADYYPARSWKTLRLSSPARDLAVGEDGAMWVVTEKSKIYMSPKVGQAFRPMPGVARKVAVGRGNDAWVVNTASQLWRWQVNKWIPVCVAPGQCSEAIPAANIDLSPDGKHLVVTNTRGHVYFSRDQGKRWSKFGDAKTAGILKVATGNATREPIVVGIRGVEILKMWNRATDSLPRIPGQFDDRSRKIPGSDLPADITVDDADTIWVTAVNGAVYAMPRGADVWVELHTLGKSPITFNTVSAGKFPLFASTATNRIGYVKEEW